MENEWESLALGPGWAPLLRALGQEEEEVAGLPTGVQSWAARGALCRAPGVGVGGEPSRGWPAPLPTGNPQETQGEKAEPPPCHCSASPLPSLHARPFS